MTDGPGKFSNFIIYIDESGDHALDRIDPDYPVFVLAFCIFNKAEYSAVVSPALQQLKFKYFGHDAVIFHERDIRKALGKFAILLNRTIRTAFMEDVNALIRDLPVTLIAVVIDKSRLTATYVDPTNPYHLALEFGLERVARALEARGEMGCKTHLIFESRGNKENNDLELAFRRVMASNGICGRHGFEMEMAFKATNAAGLQIADLMARPIGRYIIDGPGKPNRAFDLLRPKFRVGPWGIRGFGLKIFP